MARRKSGRDRWLCQGMGMLAGTVLMFAVEVPDLAAASDRDTARTRRAADSAFAEIDSMREQRHEEEREQKKKKRESKSRSSAIDVPSEASKSSDASEPAASPLAAQSDPATEPEADAQPPRSVVELEPSGKPQQQASSTRSNTSPEGPVPTVNDVVSTRQDQEAAQPELPTVRYGFDFLPFVGTSGSTGGSEVRQVSLNLVGGIAGAVDGFEAGVGFNVDRRYLRGVQLAGGANIVGGHVWGVQLAGAANFAVDCVHGGQGAGAVNVVGLAGFKGIQGAGGLNVAIGPGQGVQGAGGANFILGDLLGVQAAGGANIAQNVRGWQFAGGFNFARSIHGGQIAGGLNVAGAIDGAQIGPVNFAAGEVDGFQLGIVNIARNADAAVGLISLLWGGTWDVGISGADTGFTTVSVRNGGRHTHSIYTAGVNTAAANKVYSLGYGMGWHVGDVDSLYLDFDAVVTGLHKGETWNVHNTGLLGTVRAVTVWQIFDNVGIYGGPSYNVLVTENLKGTRFSRFGLVHEQLRGSRTFTYGDDDDVRRESRVNYRSHLWGWPGFEAGVRVRL